MYQEFLKVILAYIEALNEADRKLGDVGQSNDMRPYLRRISVEFQGELCGYLADEIGGVWSWQEATPFEKEADRAKGD